MTYRHHTRGMGLFTAFLKVLFFMVFTLVSIGMIGVGAATYPDPQASIWAGAGCMCLLMVMLGALFHPHMPPYRWL